MKSYKPAPLLLMFILFVTCAHGQAWKQYTDSAKIFYQQNKTGKAIELYSKAKEALKDSIGTKTYIATCNSLAAVYEDIGKFTNAEPLYQEVKEMREKTVGKEHDSYAHSCNNLALLYEEMGLYEKAEPLYLEAKQILTKLLGKQHPDYATTCNNLALLYEGMGLYEQAEPLYLEAKQIQEKVQGKDHPDYARSCNNLANLYSRTGQYEKAEFLYLETIQLLGKLLGKQDPKYIFCSNNLALLYQDMGQYEKAAPLFLEARQILAATLGNQHPAYASSCNNLATLYQHTGLYEKAEPLYLEAKRIQEKALGKEHPDYARSCNNLALLYEEIGQYVQSEQLFLEAKQIKSKALGEEHPAYAASCNELAHLYMNMGQYNKAETLFLQAKRIQEKQLGKRHPAYASTCENLACFYWTMHQPMRAGKEFEESFAANASNLFSVFRFTGDKEKAAYIKNVLGEDEKAYSFYFSEKNQSGQPYSLSLFHRNLLLSSSEALKKLQFSANDTALKDQYSAWIKMKKQLSELYAESVDKRKENVLEIEEKAAMKEKELSRLSAVFAKQQQKVDWKDIRDKLSDDEAAVEFASFHFNDGKRRSDTVFYVANLIRKNKVLPVLVFLFYEKQLTEILYPANKKITSRSIQEIYTSEESFTGKRKYTASVYTLIWKPLEKELTGIKTVYFASVGTLHRIAFAALPVNKKQVLSDKYTLVQLATTASLVDQQDTRIIISDKIQLYGGISYNTDTAELKEAVLSYHDQKVINRSLPADLTRSSGWNELPGTKKEITGIVSLAGKYRTNIITFSGSNATEESLKLLDGKASPAILHIATHGFFFPDPKQDDRLQKNVETGKVFKLSDDPLMRSGLLFAGANHAWQNKPVDGIDDGILTSYEVSNLYLPNTKLVVLSACETGLGDIQGSEGVYGLQRAFTIAGAKYLVMSLWKVADVETAEFMQEFYKYMFAGRTIRHAFYAAQTVMRNKYRLQPYKWAAWILVG